MTKCPCQSGKDLKDCCGPILDGSAKADTAEALMRSRYSAHVQGNFEHVANTHAKAAKADYNISAAQAQNKDTTWVGFEVTEAIGGGADDETGTVTFNARYEEDSTPHTHRERAAFARENGNWVYVDGKINPELEPRRVEKVGRNDPCTCGKSVV